MSRCAGRKGFSLIEVIMALTVMAIVMGAVIKVINAYNTQTNVSTQQYQVAMLATAIKSNAKLILDAAGTVCTAITTAYANDGWGWRHPLCQNTSPFPVYAIATNVLTYNIDTGNFASTVNSIISDITPYCPYLATTATTVTFSCAGLGVTGLQYQTSTGPTTNTFANTENIFTTPHTNNTNADFLNFLDFPTAVFIQYTEFLTGSGTTITRNDMLNGADMSKHAYTLNLTDLYFDRAKKTRDNLQNLSYALTSYASATMVAEVENVTPNGLSAQDTAFVPWIWQSMATTQAGTLVLCADSTTCAVIAPGTQWASAGQTSSFAMAWLLVSANLLSSNLAYVSDAFGNPLRLILISNGCTGDVSGCGVTGPSGTNPPPNPQGSYLAAMITAGYAPRAPWSSLIVSPLCTGAPDPAHDFCRWGPVYPN